MVLARATIAALASVSSISSISVEEVARLRERFLAYARSFYADDPDPDLKAAIDLKIEHTLRVCEESRYISAALGLAADARHLAEVAALFHDVGRFAQYARYHTFSDRKSEDHAALGVRVLREREVLSALGPAEDLLLRVIGYHNRLALPGPDDETPTCLFFSRLLRDADKLDIFRVVTDYYRRPASQRNGWVAWELPDTPGISEAVCDDLMAGRVVHNDHLCNLNDFKLLQVGWVYDINFAPSLRRIRERGYLGMLRDALPDSPRIEEIFEKIEAYVAKRMDEDVNSCEGSA
jgi:putative nucleotidyltransferase with HDIG domain